MGLSRRRVLEGIDTMSEKELKIELLRQAESISVEGVVTEDALDRISVVLSGLRDLKSALQNKVSVPEHFLCPISSEIMKEPVVLATGEVLLVYLASFVFCFDSRCLYLQF